MQASDQQTFSLENFEGPIDFLLYLVQKHEIDVYEVPILEVIEQFLHEWHEREQGEVDDGAEFISSAATLVLLKSKKLLPKHDDKEEDVLDELDPKFEIIHHLIDYCKFKDFGKQLSRIEDQQIGCYYRGIHPPESVKKPMGIEHLSLNDLSVLFESVIDRAEARTGTIDEEEYRVGDKIQYIQNALKIEDSVLFEELFNPAMRKGELIVTFLAVLELMKMGQICVVRNLEEETIEVRQQEPEEEQEQKTERLQEEENE